MTCSTPSFRGALLAALTLAGLAGAQEPVTIALRERAVIGRRCVCLGDLATLEGGTEALRSALAALDIDDLPPDGQTRVCSRTQVGFRLRLAGVPPRLYTLAGAAEVLIVPQRRPLPPERVESAAREAVYRHLSRPRDALTVRLVQPIVAVLPAIAEDDIVALDAEPNSRVAGPGRVQMNVAVRINGERRLMLPVFLDAQPLGEGPGDVGTPVRPGQTVRMTVRLGAVDVVALGEALQAGRRGDLIRVRNLESKKVIAGRITGPKTVEIDAGMSQEIRHE